MLSSVTAHPALPSPPLSSRLPTLCIPIAIATRVVARDRQCTVLGGGGGAGIQNMYRQYNTTKKVDSYKLCKASLVSQF
jgi:hypothetical protein